MTCATCDAPLVSKAQRRERLCAVHCFHAGLYAAARSRADLPVVPKVGTVRRKLHRAPTMVKKLTPDGRPVVRRLKPEQYTKEQRRAIAAEFVAKTEARRHRQSEISRLSKLRCESRERREGRTP